jgi:hypothetical protein
VEEILPELRRLVPGPELPLPVGVLLPRGHQPPARWAPGEPRPAGAQLGAGGLQVGALPTDQREQLSLVRLGQAGFAALRKEKRCQELLNRFFTITYLYLFYSSPHRAALD